MTITIKQEHVFYAVVLVAAIVLAAYYHGHFDGRILPSPDKDAISKLTEADCIFVKNAIALTLQGIDNGSIKSVAVALLTIKSEIPDDIQKVVLDALPPLQWDIIKDQLLTFEGRLPY